MPFVIYGDRQHGTESFETYRVFISSNQVLVLVAMSPRDDPYLIRSINLPHKYGMEADDVCMMGD